MSVENLPKKHHYIPQFYLKGFSQDKSRLHVFDKKATTQESKFRHQATEKIAYENNLYTYRTKQLGKETLEDFFCQIEGNAQTVITKLGNREEITPIERGNLALFVSLLWLRTPTSKGETIGAQKEMAEKIARMTYHFPQQKVRMKEFFKSRGQEQTDEEIDDLVDFATDPERSTIVVDIPPEHWIKQMMMLANDIYIYLAYCKWEVKHAVKQYAYITSDHPVLLLPSEKSDPGYGIGLLTPGVKKTLPLTANMYLVMHEPQEELEPILHTTADKAFYRKANGWTMKNAERFVFSPDFGKLEKLVKTKPELTKPRGKRYRVS